MKISTAPRRTPRIVEDPDGAVVRVEKLDDRDLHGMVQDTATIIVVVGKGTSRNGPAHKIVRILEGYRTGALETFYRPDRFGAENDVRLVELREALEQKQVWMLAGCALRPSYTGDEAADHVPGRGVADGGHQRFSGKVGLCTPT